MSFYLLVAASLILALAVACRMIARQDQLDRIEQMLNELKDQE